MGTISIHGLDKDTERKIRAEVQADRPEPEPDRSSSYLAQALAKPAQGKKAASDDFSDLAGSWTKKDYEEFQKATADFRKVDPEALEVKAR